MNALAAHPEARICTALEYCALFQCRASDHGFDIKSINFKKKGLGLTTYSFQILGLRTRGSTSSWTKIQFGHLVETDRMRLLAEITRVWHSAEVNRVRYQIWYQMLKQVCHLIWYQIWYKMIQIWRQIWYQIWIQKWYQIWCPRTGTRIGTRSSAKLGSRSGIKSGTTLDSRSRTRPAGLVRNLVQIWCQNLRQIL